MVKNRTEKSRVDFHACLDSSKPQCKYKKKKIVEDFWKKVTLFFIFSYENRATYEHFYFFHIV